MLSGAKDSFAAFLLCHEILRKRGIPVVREAAAFL
jgi:hypothetical protein